MQRNAWSLALWLAASIGASGVLASPCTAGSAPSDGFGPGEFFQRGKNEVSIGSGVMFSPFVGRIAHPTTINYTLTEIQLGYMLNGKTRPGAWHGNFEFLGD